MPEYRRFIAYFYEYIDGKKTNNVGFAKVELRSGMWRILFRLTAVHSPEPPVQVYGFVREKEYLLGFLMGTMRPGSQMLEEWAYRAGNSLWKQQYGFSDLAGIWIQCGDGHRYVTVWDDDPIEINRFVLELPEERNGKQKETGAGAQEEAQNPLRSVAEAEETENGNVKRYRGEEAESSGRPGADDTNLTGSVSSDARKEAAAVSAPVSRGKTEAGDVPASESSKETAGWQEKSERNSPQVEAAQLAEDGIYTELSRRSAPPSPCDAIAMRREAFEPFEDTQFEACFKILPCDLVALQQAGLQVGRSSFLLHGFYQYHHLLLGRKKDGGFVLGVPGLQNPQERYMAQTFGFPDFKTARWKDRGQQFGYWYRSV